MGRFLVVNKELEVEPATGRWLQHFLNRSNRTAGEKNLDRSAFFSLRYLCGLNCACAWRRPSAAALNSGLSCSAASNSGILSRGFPDARSAHPRLAWAGAALLGFNRTVS